MSVITTPPPAPPATVDASSWQAWDIALRYDAVQADLTYRQQYLAAMQANTDALNRQADAITATATAQQASLKALDSYTDAELMAKFMGSLAQDWATASRGGPYMESLAKAMLTAYRALYPAPTP